MFIQVFVSFTTYRVCFEIRFNVATANHARSLKGDVARINYCKNVETIVARAEITRFEQFLTLSQCFQIVRCTGVS